MLIKNGQVLLFEEGGFVKRDIRMENGKIKTVAQELPAAADETVVDAEGKYVTVSYTHLDVYKRQVGDRRRTV